MKPKKISKPKPRLTKTINVTVTQTDVNKAEDYFSHTHCYLATALRRKGFDDLYVTGKHVSFKKGNLVKATYGIDDISISELAGINDDERILEKKIHVTLTKTK